MVELHLPEGINYECTSCGKCCGGWAVPMTDEDYERISAVDWSAIHPAYKDKRLYRELKKYEREGTPYTHKIVSDTGTCPFLVDNLCFIHSKNGAEFKPSICQLFPYCFSETPSGVYATVSFVSMGAIYNSGAPLKDQRQWLESKWQDFKQLFPDHHPDWSHIKLTVDQPMTWDEYMQHEKVLLDILDKKDRPLTNRLQECSDYLCSKRTQGAAPPATAEVPRLNKLDKNLLVTFHKMYFPSKPLRQGEGDFNTVRLVVQSFFGSQRLSLPGQSYDIDELNSMTWPDGDKDIDDLLYRYIYSYVFGKKFFGAGFGQVSLISGFHHLLLMHSLIKLHSKASAKLRGVDAVSLIDVAATVRQLERQVGETKLGGYAAAVWEMMLFPPTRARRLLAHC